MRHLLKKIIDLILYSNLWIALNAAAMAIQTQWLSSEKIQINYLVGLVFFATLFLYAIHRIVGISKLENFLEVERYKVIYTFKSHIIIYAILAVIGGAFCFFQLSWTIWLAIIIPAIISLAYVLPILGQQRRLRDLDHIKIYLIAIVWAFITVVLVVLDEDKTLDLPHFLMLAERALFVFAITLPFDIRDLKVDAHAKVKTIPSIIGIPQTKALAYAILAVSLLLVFINFQIGFYHFNTLLALLISLLSTAILIQYADRVSHDYYFTGLMDGTMLAQFLLVYFL